MFIRNTPYMSGREHGFSLIELVLFIVIVSVAGTGLLSVMNLTAAHSADPLAQKQALFIARAMLEEIEMVPPFDSVKTNYNSYSLTGGDDPGNATKVVVPVGYTVSVVVADDGGFLPPSSLTPALRISVTVTYAGGSVIVEGYRTKYTFPS
jgi:MSHA pilin protein MshD